MQKKKLLILISTLTLLLFLVSGCSANKDKGFIGGRNESGANDKKEELKGYDVIDTFEGYRTKGINQRSFELTVVPNDDSPRFIITITKVLREEYEEKFRKFKTVNFYFFEDESSASSYLKTPPEKTEALDKKMLARYNYEKDQNFSMLFEMVDGEPQVWKEIP